MNKTKAFLLLPFLVALGASNSRAVEAGIGRNEIRCESAELGRFDVRFDIENAVVGNDGGWSKYRSVLRGFKFTATPGFSIPRLTGGATRVILPGRELGLEVEETGAELSPATNQFNASLRMRNDPADAVKFVGFILLDHYHPDKYGSSELGAQATVSVKTDDPNTPWLMLRVFFRCRGLDDTHVP